MINDFHHWNYRIIKDNGTHDVREVHYDENGNITAWTTKPSILSWEEFDELKVSYKLIGSAFDKPVLVVVDNKLIEQVIACL